MRSMSMRSFVPILSVSMLATALFLSACGESEHAEASPGPLVAVAATAAHAPLIAAARASDEVQSKIEVIHQAGWTGGDQATPLANARGDLAVGFHFSGPTAGTAIDLIYLPDAASDAHVVVRPSSAESAALFNQSMRDPQDLPVADDAAPMTAADTLPEISVGFVAPTSCGALAANQGLSTNQTLHSCKNNYRLIMQSDGNAVAYFGSKAIWASNTVGKGGTRLVMQTDGNLVVYTSAGKAVWASHTNGNPGAYFRLQNDGNLVVYSSSGKALWASGTYCDSGCVGACRPWSCEYVSSIGVSVACFNLPDNPLGAYYRTTVRSGHTDPAFCVALYADHSGDGIACPNPAKTISFMTCGEAN